MISGISLFRRLPYEGLIFGPAIAVLSFLYGTSWAARITGLAFGVGIAVYTLRNAPAEVAARKASRARKRQVARELEPEDDSD